MAPIFLSARTIEQQLFGQSSIIHVFRRIALLLLFRVSFIGHTMVLCRGFLYSTLSRTILTKSGDFLK